MLWIHYRWSETYRNSHITADILYCIYIIFNLILHFFSIYFYVL